METTEKNSKRRIIFSSVKLSLTIYWKERKIILFLCALAIALRVALPFLGIMLPKVVLDAIAAQVSSQQFIWTVGGLALLLVAINYFKGYTDTLVNNSIGSLGIGNFYVLMLKKMMRIDYELMEDPAFKAVEDKSNKAAQSNHSPAMNIPRMMVEFFANVIGFLLYASVIALIHPLILVLLILTALVNWFMLSRARKYMESTREERSKLTKKLWAIKDTLRDPAAAKDIRMYSALSWLNKLFEGQFALVRKAEKGLLTKEMHSQLTDALMILLRDGAAYAFLIWLVLDNQLSLGDFVFVFAAIGALAGWVSGILTSATDLTKACVEMDDINATLTYPDRMNTGPGMPLPAGSALPPSIELKNLSYTYPGAEKPALKDVNVTIHAGERIAIVGANGAGKTTLVKLICGLYLPTVGEVLLNHQPVSAYNRDEYYTLFSAVFQDIHLLPVSIAENISQRPPEETDREKVAYCLELTGLSEKIASVSEHADALLVRSVNAEAAELSGGEKQKLAMARALYKGAPVVALDEPTAALDPIAENEVYQKYAELTAGKTSIYISHRLASTRFCDRILLLDGNIVAEEGTHDELMALGGVYARMFEVQASYYQDGAQAEEEVAV